MSFLFSSDLNVASESLMLPTMMGLVDRVLIEQKRSSVFDSHVFYKLLFLC